MTINEAELRKLAEVATPGEWEADSIKSEGEYGTDDDGGYGFISYAITDDKNRCIADCLNNDNGMVQVESDGRAFDVVAERNAKYIAAANPATIIALLDELAALKSATPAQPIAPSTEPMSTDEAREVLIGFMNEHFSDRSFHRYIRGTRDNGNQSINLAGDFAWQMATALRRIGASPCAMCNGAGSVGHAPDGYFDCPDCTPVAQPIADVSAPTDELPITRSTYGTKEECEAEHARRAARAAAPVSGPSDAANFERMFVAACEDLAAISDTLGLDSDIEGGAAPILEAIESLRTAAPMPSRFDLEAIERAMDHMGDQLNDMDAAEERDELITAPGFEAIARLLEAAPEQAKPTEARELTDAYIDYISSHMGTRARLQHVRMKDFARAIERYILSGGVTPFAAPIHLTATHGDTKGN